MYPIDGPFPASNFLLASFYLCQTPTTAGVIILLGSLITDRGCRWGSKLINDGDITFYQFIVSFMGIYFSGQAAGQLFSFASSFTKANEATNYCVWLSNLSATIQETAENRDNGPPDNCQAIHFQNIHFSYPLAPDTRVLKGVSLNVRIPSILS
jgi:ABC-type multidrug transport system fused ATPase/permease subunit